jgi:predicted TIM-barrel fold metal-dependent hydrolase
MTLLDSTPSLKRRIVDAHHHFWDPQRNYHPWLCDPEPIAFRYGDYSSLRRPYLSHDYKDDARNFTIEGSVYIETEWDPNDLAAETRYVAELRSCGLPSVAVMAARLHEPDVERLLASHAAHDFVRGIRHKPRANSSPREASPGGMTDTQWRRGYAVLRDNGFSFDLQTPWWHMGEAADLASAFADIPMIVNHAGLPADRSEEGLAAWKQAMTRVAAHENIAIKVSGIGRPGHPWTAQANRRIVLTLIDLFGVPRCMFASNFPVDSLCGTFDDIFSGFEAITADFTEAERDALFRSNALRIYRIPPT